MYVFETWSVIFDEQYNYLNEDNITQRLHIYFEYLTYLTFLTNFS